MLSDGSMLAGELIVEKPGGWGWGKITVRVRSSLDGIPRL
jgi:hypothetical protein